MHDSIDAILDFWFGPLDEHGFCRDNRHGLWFGADPATDRHCRERFGDVLAQAASGGCDHWAQGDDGLVALVVLLDQFSRNIHRGTAAAFANDPRALATAASAIDANRHLRLPPIHRVFLYLPLEHSEDLGVQQRCVALYTELESEVGSAAVGEFARYARAHRDVIARFGRFPHRNAILGRPSTAGERAHLAQHGGF